MSKQPEIRGELSIVAIAHVAPNPWNPNRQDEATYQNQLASIQRYGFIQPIVVRELAPDKYQVIDGEHRLRAANELKMSRIPIWNLGKKSDADAKMLTEVFIHLRGNPDLELEAKLIRSLTADHKVSIAALADSIPLTADQIESLDKSLDFDWEAMKEKMNAAPPPPASPPEAGPPAGSTSNAHFVYRVFIECDNEKQQLALVHRLQEEGYKCRVLVND